MTLKLVEPRTNNSEISPDQPQPENQFDLFFSALKNDKTVHGFHNLKRLTLDGFMTTKVFNERLKILTHLQNSLE